MLTSDLDPTVGSCLRAHSARRPAISFGSLTAGRSAVSRGDGKVAGPVMCRPRTWRLRTTWRLWADRNLRARMDEALLADILAGTNNRQWTGSGGRNKR